MSKQRYQDKRNRNYFTNCIVEGLPGLFVPDERGLPLVGHSNSWTHRFFLKI